MGNSVLARLARLQPVMKTVSLPRGRHRLHVMPTTTGYERRERTTYDWNGRRRGPRPFTVLQHTVAGEGSLLFERRRYRLRPGDTMLLLVPHNHRYWLPQGGSWEFFWISMSGQEAVRVHRAIQATTGPLLKMSSDAVEHIADCCLRLIEGHGETPGAASAIAYEALGALYDDVFGPHSATPTEFDDAIVRQVVEHILVNLDARLSVSDLAEIAGLSRAYFTRVFTASEGMPPAEFVLRERMRRAARLLAAHALPVKEIAALCGFHDPNYFAKAFRRFFGRSPTEFRASGISALPFGGLATPLNS